MSWTGGGTGNAKRLNTFLMSEDRWQRALKEHTVRVRHVKPAVDLKSPWGCSRPYVPLPPGDQQDKSSARQRPSSAAGGRPQSAQSTGRRSATGQQHQPSMSRPGSAQSGTTQAHPGPRPTSATSRASSSAAGGGGGSGGGSRAQNGSQVISQLPLNSQRLCEEMTKMLTGLDKDQSKMILEHLYSAAEEGRLLQSYSGVYPHLIVSNASGKDDDAKSFEDEEEL